jgi:Ice-binding-like
MYTFFLSLFQRRFGKAIAGQRSPPRPSFRPFFEGLGNCSGRSLQPSFLPSLERLEERTVPSLIASQIFHHVGVTPGTVPFEATTQVITLTAFGSGTVTFTVTNSEGGVIGTPVSVKAVNGVATTPFTLPAGTLPGSYTVTTSGGSTGTFTVGVAQTASCGANTFLGSAASFAVLGASTVTNVPAPDLPTTIDGNVGVDPGSTITGQSNIVLTGQYHEADALALQAQNAVTTAYGVLAGEPVTQDLSGVDLDVYTRAHPLKPGVYKFDSSAQLSGALYLDFEGNPNAVFVFQIGTTLTTASGSSVNIINAGGKHPGNVYWQVGSSATLGTTTSFVGNILAYTSITLDHGATISCGRALARGVGGVGGAVTMDNNTVSIM